MRIRFIQSYSSTRDSFKRGDEEEVDDKEAESLIAGGVAAAVVAVLPKDPAADTTKAEPAKPPARRVAAQRA